MQPQCDITIRSLLDKDIQLLEKCRHEVSKWQQYYQEHQQHISTVYVLESGGRLIGYGSLLYKSKYVPFAQDNIPEIHDVWIDERYRNKGFGTKFITHVETAARDKGYTYIGIGVGLYADYGTAQRLYVRLGYVPDGKGVTYNYSPIIPGQSYPIDDDLILWLKKALSIGVHINSLVVSSSG